MDGLSLRVDLTAEAREKWRSDVAKAAERVARVYADGDHAGSRMLAEEAGEPDWTPPRFNPIWPDLDAEDDGDAGAPA